jgi:hypothetical protein
MEERGLSQAALLRLCEPFFDEESRFTAPVMSFYVRGIYMPRDDRLAVIAKALGLSFEWLKDGKEPNAETDSAPETVEQPSHEEEAEDEDLEEETEDEDLEDEILDEDFEDKDEDEDFEDEDEDGDFEDVILDGEFEEMFEDEDSDDDWTDYSGNYRKEDFQEFVGRKVAVDLKNLSDVTDSYLFIIPQEDKEFPDEPDAYYLLQSYLVTADGSWVDITNLVTDPSVIEDYFKEKTIEVVVEFWVDEKKTISKIGKNIFLNGLGPEFTLTRQEELKLWSYDNVADAWEVLENKFTLPEGES